MLNSQFFLSQYTMAFQHSHLTHHMPDVQIYLKENGALHIYIHAFRILIFVTFSYILQPLGLFCELCF